MKKILLSTALAALTVSAVSAEAFSGVIAGFRGSVLGFHKGAFSNLTKASVAADTNVVSLDKESADYGGFGFNGAAGLIDLGYSYRFSNNFVFGVTGSAGYRHHTINEARDTSTDGKKIGMDFVQSSLTFEGRLRLGAAFGRFHIFVNPGVALDYANPELTFRTKAAKDGAEDDSKKVTWATDKEPGLKERVSFVMGLNVEYAMTQTIAVGGSVGCRVSFAEVKLKDLSEETKKVVTGGEDILGYKSPWGIEAGLHVTASF